MKRLKRSMATILALFALCSMVSAGWVHDPLSKVTRWSSVPTPATCWTRDFKLNTVWTVQKVLVYADTPRYFNYTAAAATVDLACTGYWAQDASGIFWPRTDLDGAWEWGVNNVNVEWIDVEWYMGTDNILWAK